MSLLDFTILKSSRMGILPASNGFGVKVDIGRFVASYKRVKALAVAGLGEVRVVVPKNTKPNRSKRLIGVRFSADVGGPLYNMLNVSKWGYCPPRKVLGAP